MDLERASTGHLEAQNALQAETEAHAITKGLLEAAAEKHRGECEEAEGLIRSLKQGEEDVGTALNEVTELLVAERGKVSEEAAAREAAEEALAVKAQP